MKLTKEIIALFNNPSLTAAQAGLTFKCLIDPTNNPPPTPTTPHETAIIQNILHLYKTKKQNDKELTINRFKWVKWPYLSITPFQKIPTAQISQLNRIFWDLTIIEQAPNSPLVKAISKTTKKTYTHNIGRFESGYISGRTNKHIKPINQTQQYTHTPSFQVFYKKLYYSYILLNSPNKNSLQEALNFPNFLEQYDQQINQAQFLLLEHNISIDKAHYHLRFTTTEITFTPTPTTTNFLLVTKK